MNWTPVRYSIWAPVYDALLSYLPSFEAARQRSISHLGLRDGQHVLIIGAGTGLDLPHIAAGVKVTAVDVTSAMLARLRGRASGLAVEVDARVMDGRALSFPDGRFDAVVMHLILAVMPEPDVGLRGQTAPRRHAVSTIPVAFTSPAALHFAAVAGCRAPRRT